MFFFANLSEYNGNIDFNTREYSDESYVPLRITPSFFSSLCSPLLYLTMRFSSFSKFSSLTTSILICFDTSMICEGKFILSDGLLHFFTCLHLTILSYSLSLSRNTTSYKLWQVLTGLSLGAACSCKNTALGLCALNGLIHSIELFYEIKHFSTFYFRELIYRGCVLFLCAFFIYILSFNIHFIVLPYYGQGNGYLPPDMQHQLVDPNLIGHEIWGNRVLGHSLIWRSLELTLIMHTGNMHITKFHPYQSRPIGWPLLTDIKVAFWFEKDREIACMGNVFTYYFAFFGVFALFFAWFSEKWLIAIKFSLGWCVSYLPFFLVPRSMYLYHYLIPLMLGSCAFGAAIDIFIPQFLRGIVAAFVCFLVIFGFILWAPYTYGLPGWDKDVVIWNKNWNTGDAVHQELARKSKT
ncbi:Dolichyl-phosphate-mannose-protein mannosyltransferase [Histomonas meleagridis]|uniref:Dolichyl-phosphate-mannose-protein mannosyltransferase n=1 Tax=Histomonas meleagridis TaxID=135588 RepID=UPI00355A36CA|nr:Dolichyl-phosphate-mannose-protein mannosyltransferase [Histomonas meleagridis]KAH0797108.1 Dolichyl-phosphate-mannose-protein mannosyltransferase [Histomonas meleagridis]